MGLNSGDDPLFCLGKTFEAELRAAPSPILEIKHRFGRCFLSTQAYAARVTGVGQFAAVKVEDLKPGDRLVYDRTNQPKSSECTTNLSLAWTLGFVSGRVNILNGKIVLGIRTEELDEECNREARRILLHTFGLRAKMYKSGAHYKLEEFNEKFGHLICGEFNVEVPKEILRSTENVRWAYIAGLYDAQSQKKRRYRLNVDMFLARRATPNFVNGIKTLADSLGLPCRTYREFPGKNIAVVDDFSRFDRYTSEFSIKSKHRKVRKSSYGTMTYPHEMVKSFIQENNLKNYWGMLGSTNQNHPTLTIEKALRLKGDDIDLTNWGPVEILSIEKTDLDDGFVVLANQYNVNGIVLLNGSTHEVI